MGTISGYFSFRRKPRGVWKWLLKLPILIFRARLGFLFGDRFILLEHRGRRSGLRRFTPLEVTYHDVARCEYLVVSGTGPRSDWLLNILDCPAAAVWVGSRRVPAPPQRFVPLDEAMSVMESYEEEHPQTAAALERSMGVSHDGTHESRVRMMERIPMVGFTVV